MSENISINTVASINQTVLDAVNSVGVNISGYESVGDAVVKALQERENTIAEQIIESAENRYGYGDQAKEVIVDAGLYLKPEPVVEQEAPVFEEAPAAELTTDERLGKIEETLAALAKRIFGDNF